MSFAVVQHELLKPSWLVTNQRALLRIKISAKWSPAEYLTLVREKREPTSLVSDLVSKEQTGALRLNWSRDHVEHSLKSLLRVLHVGSILQFAYSCQLRCFTRTIYELYELFAWGPCKGYQFLSCVDRRPVPRPTPVGLHWLELPHPRQLVANCCPCSLAKGGSNSWMKQTSGEKKHKCWQGF